MKTSDFTFDLPPHLIAQTPLAQRDGSRLLHLDKESGAIAHHHFYDLPQFLREGDCLILNDSRVLPARLLGTRCGGGVCEVLLLTQVEQGETTAWECLVKPGKKLRLGAEISFGEGKLTAKIAQVMENGNRIVEFYHQGIFLEVLEELGTMPLPPYIKERLEDQERYQTVYSKEAGSAAAPTAGLHFTPELLKKIEDMGVKLGYVTLHVGLGTFRPVQVEEVTTHQMHSEFARISEETAQLIQETKAKGGRVIGVGTTSCRTLESFAKGAGGVDAGAKWTDIFIYPGYQFQVIDGLITNFHLPESTLIMLVSALAGKKEVEKAYQVAVEEGYRFFSFGDCSIIL